MKSEAGELRPGAPRPPAAEKGGGIQKRLASVTVKEGSRLNLKRKKQVPAVLLQRRRPRSAAAARPDRACPNAFEHQRPMLSRDPRISRPAASQLLEPRTRMRLCCTETPSSCSGMAWPRACFFTKQAIRQNGAGVGSSGGHGRALGGNDVRYQTGLLGGSAACPGLAGRGGAGRNVVLQGASLMGKAPTAATRAARRGPGRGGADPAPSSVCSSGPQTSRPAPPRVWPSLGPSLLEGGAGRKGKRGGAGWGAFAERRPPGPLSNEGPARALSPAGH